VTSKLGRVSNLLFAEDKTKQAYSVA